MQKWYLVSIALIFVVFNACADGGADQKAGVEQEVAKYRNPSLGALSPRDGGYMDVNNAANPTFAVFNTAGSTIDFELWGDSVFGELIAVGAEIGKPEDTTYTPWSPAIPLDAGREYYWRVKVTGGDWHSLFSFTVKNLCDIGGVSWAEHVSEFSTQRQCDIINHKDPNLALGSSNASGYVDNNNPGTGFVSIDSAGELTVEMGKTIRNGAGADVRVFEYISFEWIEVLAGNSEIGPWHSMGVARCGEWCDFDLGRAGLNYARYIKIIDLMSPFSSCHQTAGADIDAIKALNYTSKSNQCG